LSIGALSVCAALVVGTAPAAQPEAGGQPSTAAEVHSPAQVPADGAHPAEGSHAAAADAAGEGHGGGAVNPVTFDPDLAIVTAIIFLVLLAVLWKFAWGPIVAALDTRERTMAEQLAEAKRSQEESRRLLAEHEARLAGAAAEVKQLLDQARRDADDQKQQILATAQAAAVAEKERAVREIQAAKRTALQELATTSVDRAVDLAGQIVRRQLTPEDHSQLVNDALQKYTSEN
jgi:F-type H+-transporting ATPase subunit b